MEFFLSATPRLRSQSHREDAHSRQVQRRHIPWLKYVLMAAPFLVAVTYAQTPEDDAVHWTAVLKSTRIDGGVSTTLEVIGAVGEGWHVYALVQQPGGPTPLRVSLDATALATTAGPFSATPPENVQDTHFGFETHLYSHNFTVSVPIHLGHDLGSGQQLIPVSVRFQACSDRECLLPRTIHLSVPIEAAAAP